MQIVSASVHHRNIASSIIFGVHFTGVCKSGFLVHGQRIQFRAQHDCWSRAILQDRDHSRPSHVLSHLIAGAAQACGKLFRRADFVA